MTMKKLILILLIAVCTVCTAQTKHMKFKGIPMAGTLDSFVQKLKQKGLNFIDKEDGISMLKGEFAATKGCTILVSRFAERDQVNMVVVIFPEDKTWNSLTNRYYNLKEMLSEKYGMPDCEESFSGSVPNDDFLRFHALLKDECHFLSEFTCENGTIQLSMKKSDVLSAVVFLRYIDKVNADETHKKAMDDL